MKICKGTNRIVFLVSRWAIKVPAFIPHGWALGVYGILASLREAGTWEALCCEGAANEDCKPMLVPVSWSFAGLVLVQPRGERVSTQDWNNWDGFDRMTEFCGDIKQENTVLLNGQIRVCDYGSVA